MFDVSRLRWHAITLTGLILAAWLWSLLIAPLTRDSSVLVKTDSTMDISMYKGYGKRLAGVVRERARKPEAANPRLGVLLGSSTLEDGVDPAMLTEGSKGSIQWLSLFGHDVNLVDMRNLSRLFFMSKLKADVLVIAVQLGMFAHNDNLSNVQKGFDFRLVLKALLAKQVGLVQQSIEDAAMVPFDRLFPNRIWINQRARNFVNDARIQLFSDLNVGVESLFPPLPDPWIVPHRYPGVVRANDLTVQKILDQLDDRGWFQGKNYSPDSDRCQAYIDLIKGARASGAIVYVLVVPESLMMKERIPKEALRCVSEPLEREFGKDAPKVLNFRDAMPEKYFYDAMHLSSEGRPIFSKMLSEALEKNLANEPRPPVSAPSSKRP